MQESLKKLASALGQSDPDPTQLREVLTRVADFLQLNPAAARAGSTPLEFLMDVTVPMRAELGHASVPIGELLKLEAGSVVELDREVSQPVDLTVSGILFARGEVVVVEDHFAVRIKELVQPRGTRWPR
jgi:flagellar motor switch protein FliN/FliY